MGTYVDFGAYDRTRMSVPAAGNVTNTADGGRYIYGKALIQGGSEVAGISFNVPVICGDVYVTYQHRAVERMFAMLFVSDGSMYVVIEDKQVYSGQYASGSNELFRMFVDNQGYMRFMRDSILIHKSMSRIDLDEYPRAIAIYLTMTNDQVANIKLIDSFDVDAPSTLFSMDNVKWNVLSTYASRVNINQTGVCLRRLQFWRVFHANDSVARPERQGLLVLCGIVDSRRRSSKYVHWILSPSGKHRCC